MKTAITKRQVREVTVQMPRFCRQLHGCRNLVTNHVNSIKALGKPNEIFIVSKIS